MMRKTFQSNQESEGMETGKLKINSRKECLNETAKCRAEAKPCWWSRSVLLLFIVLSFLLSLLLIPQQFFPLGILVSPTCVLLRRDLFHLWSCLCFLSLSDHCVFPSICFLFGISWTLAPVFLLSCIIICLSLQFGSKLGLCAAECTTMTQFPLNIQKCVHFRSLKPICSKFCIWAAQIWSEQHMWTQIGYWKTWGRSRWTPGLRCTDKSPSHPGGTGSEEASGAVFHMKEKVKSKNSSCLAKED